MKGQIFILGRQSDKVNIVIDHSTISSVHAQLVLINGEIHIVDLNSKNGISINGSQVKNAIIKKGDKIQFGKYECSYDELLNSLKQSLHNEGKTSLPVILLDKNQNSKNKLLNSRKKINFRKIFMIIFSVTIVISLLILANNLYVNSQYRSKEIDETESHDTNQNNKNDQSYTQNTQEKQEVIRKQKINTEYDYSCMEDEDTGGDFINLFSDITRDINSQLSDNIEISVKDEEEYGNELYNQMIEEYHFLRNDESKKLERILHSLVIRIAKPRGFDYKVHLIDDPTVNAYTAGGRIFFFKGMLDFCKSDSEIAAILGHEIGHNECSHINEQIKNYMAAEQFGDLGVLLHSMSSMITMSFNQKQEVQADYFGMDLLYPTTFKNCSGIDLWDRMSEEENNPNLVENIFRTHPFSAKRSNCIYHHLESNYNLNCD